MHYMKSTRVMLPVIFREFEIIYISFATCFFSLSFSFGKRSILAKFWGAAVLPVSPRFYGLFAVNGKTNFKRNIYILREENKSQRNI